MQAADELTMNIVDVEAGKLLMNAVRPVTDITCRHLHEVIHNFLVYTLSVVVSSAVTCEFMI